MAPLLQRLVVRMLQGFILNTGSVRFVRGLYKFEGLAFMVWHFCLGFVYVHRFAAVAAAAAAIAVAIAVADGGGGGGAAAAAEVLSLIYCPCPRSIAVAAAVVVDGGRGRWCRRRRRCCCFVCHGAAPVHLHVFVLCVAFCSSPFRLICLHAFM